MAFLNGFPDEESIKLPLYSVEPEQLSDLVAVPFSGKKLWNIELLSNHDSNSSKADKDIHAVSFPLSDFPCLFQRYNPTGKNFADNYSTKLYEWRKKYSRSALLDIVPYLKPDDEEINPRLVTLNFNIGEELKIKLPNNGKRINFSYYYPELNPEGFYIYSSFDNFRFVEPLEVENWRTVVLENNAKPYAINEAYNYPRIDNDCIGTEYVRAWLLKFETHFCKKHHYKTH